MAGIIKSTPKKKVHLSFKLPYYTEWGQSLIVSGSEPILGSWNVKQGLPLSPIHAAHGELLWCGSLLVPVGFECQYSYYVVDGNKNVLRWEAKKHGIRLDESVEEGDVVQVHDLWQTAVDSLYFKSAFKDVILNQCKGSTFSRESKVPRENILKQDNVYVHFQIVCPRVDADTSVFVTGSAEYLGSWVPEKGIQLRCSDQLIWEGYCLVQKSEFPLQYKYCQVSQNDSRNLEVGPNRELIADSVLGLQPQHIFASDGVFRETPWRGAGVAIPMFSVRSDDDLGVGEFLDLKLLVVWAVDCGFHLVQLLPVNDTSVHGMWWDSYPYSSLSVFALHPLYLRVQALSSNLSEEIQQEITKAQTELNSLKDVDYEAAMAKKISISKKVFALEKDMVFESSSFKEFLRENEGWLKPYAAFCFLRDFFETSDHSQWGCFSKYSVDMLEKIISKSKACDDSVLFHYYIQYHLHLQLSEAASYARKRGVILKGDLPIGVDRHSVDTWVDPNLFRMNTSTGAPPDYFDKNGQNWGFPTYNWEEMSKDNYAWWRARLAQMAKYFTAYRIDHILGFFRIWELPEHAVTGLVGKFRPSIPLSQEELEKEGIWDFNRLCHPYIRKEMLEEKFGSMCAIINASFLNEYEKNCYEFKEDCNTEKKIIAKLKYAAQRSLWSSEQDKVQHNLFELLKNVVLIRDVEDPRKFYPRFNIEDTSSFRDLDKHSKNVLRRLYYDYYFHRQESTWRQNALRTLPVLLSSSDMLACGEDLGLIPACVPPVLLELGLIGLRIQRMPSEPGVEFGVPSQYEYMTVCAPSCHDCSTLRAWWEEDGERRSRYYKDIVGADGEPPSQCVPSVAHFVIEQHVESPSMWAIFPLQDLLVLKQEYTSRPAVEETINDPTNPKHYWRFRMHIAMESLYGDKELKTMIKELVIKSGRSCPPQEYEFSKSEVSTQTVAVTKEFRSFSTRDASSCAVPVMEG